MDIKSIYKKEYGKWSELVPIASTPTVSDDEVLIELEGNGVLQFNAGRFRSCNINGKDYRGGWVDIGLNKGRALIKNIVKSEVPDLNRMISTNTSKITSFVNSELIERKLRNGYIRMIY